VRRGVRMLMSRGDEMLLLRGGITLRNVLMDLDLFGIVSYFFCYLCFRVLPARTKLAFGWLALS